MISFSTLTYDLQGIIALEAAAGTKITPLTRRVTKAATLDGGSTIVDFGHSPSDLDMVINVQDISADGLARLKRMVRLYPFVNLATSEGFFMGCLSAFNADQVPMTLTFMVKERLSVGAL